MTVDLPELIETQTVAPSGRIDRYVTLDAYDPREVEHAALLKYPEDRGGLMWSKDRLGNFDRQGRPIPLAVWSFLIEYYNQDYKRVAESTFPNGFWVSTVWLGLDHSFGYGNIPIIYETMIFWHGQGEVDPRDDHIVEAQWRYHTELEARSGHEQVVAWMEAGAPPTHPPMT